METEKKTLGGRRKLEMKVIGDDSRRHVAFSKRKAGIINKAAELSVLTGSEVVVIVFSKYGKAYTFSTPDGPALLSAVRNGVTPSFWRPNAAAESEAVRELRRLEESAKRYAEGRKREKDGGFWWDRTVTEAEDADGFLAALKDLRRMVAEKATAAKEEEEEEGTFEGLIDGDDAVNGLMIGSSPSSVVYN